MLTSSLCSSILLPRLVSIFMTLPLNSLSLPISISLGLFLFVCLFYLILSFGTYCFVFSFCFTSCVNVKHRQVKQLPLPLLKSGTSAEHFPADCLCLMVLEAGLELKWAWPRAFLVGWSEASPSANWGFYLRMEVGC